jgi:hypothetical protein
VFIFDVTTAARVARPALVQFAKTFQMECHSAVNAPVFPQTFPQKLCESFAVIGGRDLKLAESSREQKHCALCHDLAQAWTSLHEGTMARSSMKCSGLRLFVTS